MKTFSFAKTEKSYLYKVTHKVPKTWVEKKSTFGTVHQDPAGKGMIPPGIQVATTCHGTCTQSKLGENIAKASKLLSALGNSEVIRDEKVKDGVWIFVARDERGPKNIHHQIGVSYWKPDWPRVLFCTAHLDHANLGLLDAIIQACLTVRFDVEDQLFPRSRMAEETGNLAKCPSTSALTYTPEKADGKPKEFGAVKAAYAKARDPKSLSLFVANFETDQTRFNRDKRLTSGQVVARFQVYAKKGKEVAFSGNYPVSGDPDARTTLGLHIEGGTTLQWSGRTTKGGVTITARTKDKICGTIDISGGGRGTLSGSFVAEIRE
jgi:hypothetical protein